MWTPRGVATRSFRHSDVPPRDAQRQSPRITPAEARAADVRSQAVGRLRQMNVMHGKAAWERRRRDPISPYGLAFLYTFADSRRPDRFAVAAATRLWLVGPESRELPRLLFTFDQYVNELSNQGPFDIRAALTHRQDPMPADAIYSGIGLSSLDTHTGTWDEVCQRTGAEADVAGRALVVLTDQTLMVCERRGLNEFNELHVYCNHSLEIAAGRTLYPCSWTPTDNLRKDGADGEVWRFLEQLNETLSRADNARLAAWPISSERVHRSAHAR